MFTGKHRLCSSLLCNFLCVPVTSAILYPNILSVFFSNTFSLCFSHNERDQVSHLPEAYNISVLYSEGLSALGPAVSWLCVTAYSLNLQLRYIPGGCPPHPQPEGTVYCDDMAVLNIDTLTVAPFLGILIVFRMFSVPHILVNITVNKSSMMIGFLLTL
jgi:hypothetical protein